MSDDWDMDCKRCGDGLSKTHPGTCPNCVCGLETRIDMLKAEVAAQAKALAAAAAVARELTERAERAEQLREVAEKFHDVAVAERNAARYQVQKAEAGAAEARKVADRYRFQPELLEAAERSEEAAKVDRDKWKERAERAEAEVAKEVRAVLLSGVAKGIAIRKQMRRAETAKRWSAMWRARCRDMLSAMLPASPRGRRG